MNNTGNSDQRSEKEIFFAALEQPTPEARAAFLDGACGKNPLLRQRIESLLADHFAADSFLQSAAVDSAAAVGKSASLQEETGLEIGRYKLLEKIGEGGFGEVWMAGQREPIKRRVAFKIIKLGMDSKQVVARFEAERQALAMMDHPNIARIFDGGVTDAGRPYFVMELVRGIKITDYCDQRQLPTRERLELFIQVCQAIQHAHQKGIIHRDIKPSNILVTLHDGVPVPKVIDFGIAKATQQELTDKTLFTQFQQFLGTPAYMSPEQAEASGLDIDTRADIYSLGVLLYELLTGRTPFDSKELLSLGLEVMRKTIREKAPLKPSTKLHTLQGEELTTTAKRHGVDAPKLVSQLRGDLDWIVMKCLEKDRTRRYETANGLAVDLKRHLKNEPVLARPPSKLYEFQKTVRRHKVGFAATAAIFVVLAAGVLVSTWQAVQATHAKREALKAQADEAKQRAVAQQALFNWLVGQAHAARLARKSGYRDRVFGLLEKAKALAVAQTNMAALRDEAVTCLGDVAGFTPKTFAVPTNVNPDAVALAPSGSLAALSCYDDAIRLLKMPSGKQIARLVGTNGEFYHMCFNSTGDQLFAIAGGPSFYHWTRDADGRWRETAHGAVHATNLRLFATSLKLLNAGTEVFASTLDFRELKSHGPKFSRANFRLFNLETGTFVPGYNATYNLTNGFVWHGLETAKSPDGGVIALETWDTQKTNSPVTVSLYDWKSGRRINHLQFPSYRALSLSPDGKYLGSFSDFGGAIYTVPGLECIGQFTGNLDLFEPFWMFAPFARNKVAMPIYQPSQIRVWNLVTRKDIALLDEPEYAVPAALAPDGSSLLTWTPGADNRLRFFRLATPAKLDLPPHDIAVPGIAFSPDGMNLASVGKDRVIRVCDARTGRILWQTNDLPGMGQCVAYSPDGRWLATGYWDTNQVWIWDAHTGERLLELGTNGPGRTWLAQFSPDGRYLATAGTEIRVYRVQREKTADAKGRPVATLIKRLPVAVRNLMFAPDGRFLTFDKSDKHNNLHMFVWDFTASSQPRDTGFQVASAHQTESFIQDGRYLLGLDSMGKITTLKMPSGKRISSFQVRKPNEDTIDAICLSPDGSRLVIVSASNLGVEVWNPKTGKRLYSLPEAPGTIYWLAWSPDSRHLAIARANGNITIWNLHTVGQILAKLGLSP